MVSRGGRGASGQATKKSRKKIPNSVDLHHCVSRSLTRKCRTNHWSHLPGCKIALRKRKGTLWGKFGVELPNGYLSFTWRAGVGKKKFFIIGRGAGENLCRA